MCIKSSDQKNKYVPVINLLWFSSFWQLQIRHYVIEIPNVPNYYTRCDVTAQHDEKEKTYLIKYYAKWKIYNINK